MVAAGHPSTPGYNDPGYPIEGRVAADARAVSALARAQNIADLREMARRRLPRGIFEYVDRGTEDEVALRQNRAAFDGIRFRPHMLVDVSQRTTECTILGKQHSMPLAIAPTGAAGLVWYEGEVEIARAAKEAGVPCTLSTPSITALEKIAETGVRAWFQLYMWADRNLSHQLVARAKAAGFEALIVTVDTPVMANREFNVRNGYSMPLKPSPALRHGHGAASRMGHFAFCCAISVHRGCRATRISRPRHGRGSRRRAGSHRCSAAIPSPGRMCASCAGGGTGRS